MEYHLLNLAVVVLFSPILAGIHASILYPTDGNNVVADTLINPKDVFLTSSGMTILGVNYIQGYVSIDKYRLV